MSERDPIADVLAGVTLPAGVMSPRTPSDHALNSLIEVLASMQRASQQTMPQFEGDDEDPKPEAGAGLGAWVGAFEQRLDVREKIPEWQGMLGDDVPSGVIVMWHGSIDDIPDGWVLCNGDNDTPNLMGKFVVGYDTVDAAEDPVGDYGVIGNTGGNDVHGDAANDHDEHPIEAIYIPSTDPTANTNVLVDDDPQHSETDNRPPYYVIAFIMKE